MTRMQYQLQQIHKRNIMLAVNTKVQLQITPATPPSKDALLAIHQSPEMLLAVKNLYIQHPSNRLCLQKFFWLIFRESGASQARVVNNASSLLSFLMKDFLKRVGFSG